MGRSPSPASSLNETWRPPFLNIGTAALIHDIPKALFGRTLERELLWARVGTLLLALVAALFALYSYYVNDRLVALLGAFGRPQRTPARSHEPPRVSFGVL